MRRRAEKKRRTTGLTADLAAFKKERNRVVNLMNEARRVYYNQFIEDNSTDRRRLFMASKSLLNMHLDRYLPPHTDSSSLANDMGEFFITKIANIKSKLDGITPSHLPSTSEADLASEPSDIVLSYFQCQTVEAIRDKITSGKKKSCILDPKPVTLLAACLDPLLSVITHMVNLSLRTGYFANAWKTTVVHPLLKKPGLDLLFKNFRPIRNLQFVSKLTERAVANQIQSLMFKNNLFPQLQSAYRSHHSTETALLKVKNDLLMIMDKGHVSLLVLLDLSAAFDTVDHKILLKTLQMKLGVCGSALSWFKSYLEGRSQRICIKETLSQSFDLQWGVPQGSCLGPLLFTIYSIDLFSLWESHLPTTHAYADDTQLYLSFSLTVGTGELDAVTAIENCIQDIRQWMCVRKLMLNDDKTEFLLVGTRKQLTKVSIDGVRVGDYNISLSPSVRNLGTWFDPHYQIALHIIKTCSSAFYYLHNIRHIRKYLSRSSSETLTHAFITSRLDYCNSLLYGLPKYQLSKLQRVMNASARLVYCAPKSCHITPLLRELHWLPVCYRIEYKIILLTFKYSAPFRNYANITEPLCKFTCNDATWKWEQPQTDAFNSVKAALSPATAMPYFSPYKETKIIVDANPVGIAGILVLDDQPIAYGSRALSDNESRYSQTEREAFAVVLACERFDIYPYDVTNVFRPGKDNPADYMSRHQATKDVRSSREETMEEEYVEFISQTSMLNAITLEEVQAATAKDKVFQTVIELCNTGCWYEVNKYDVDQDALRQFQKTRIVIPASLQARAEQVAH
ncbi:uncharacterized protein [Acropora muricata]|uniref:uncharacterized protein n=1 Tax=Acropora muricata TaxID=159855 RepID=UPI0034E45116